MTNVLLLAPCVYLNLTGVYCCAQLGVKRAKTKMIPIFATRSNPSYAPWSSITWEFKQYLLGTACEGKLLRFYEKKDLVSKVHSTFHSLHLSWILQQASDPPSFMFLCSSCVPSISAAMGEHGVTLYVPHPLVFKFMNSCFSHHSWTSSFCLFHSHAVFSWRLCCTLNISLFLTVWD